MGKIRIRGGRQGGQTLIIFAIAMPLFLSLVALVVDGSMLMVSRRSLQVAADAAALAAAQDITQVDIDADACSPACVARLKDTAEYYSDKNHGPTPLHVCDPTDPKDTNCFTPRYKGHIQQVEVRLKIQRSTFFTRAIGLKNAFDVEARAVASNAPQYGTSPVPGTTINGTTNVQTTPGGVHTTTDPDTVSGGSGIGFAMSRLCTAITYTGAGAKSGDPVLGAFATNGGLDLPGNAPKKITWLGYDGSRCTNNPASPPSGTNQCTSPAWGDLTESNNKCVKTLVNLNMNGTLPITWPLNPPTLPTPKSGTWDPTTDYPSKCIDLGSGTVTVDVSTRPAGIYCVNGPTANLQIRGAEPANSQGHTFFALGGGTIGLSSNSSVVNFYWPSACGPRPTIRSTSYTCFGNISGYDSMTLLYATNNSALGNCAICLSGQGNSLTGDIFAPKPDAFPPVPSLTQTGGLVTVNGGALTAGSGFIESWLLILAGNTGNYQGTGASLVIPGGTHTTTDPDIVTTIVTPGTTIAGTVQVTTIGTDFDLDE